MAVNEDLHLRGEPDSVPQARRFVTESLRSHVEAVTVADAELVVSELVTNALLHAGPPVTLRIRIDGDRVRLEVTDGSQLPPTRPIASMESMTGRGLALVDQLVTDWGFEPTTAGKTVWCELSRNRDDTTQRDIPVATAPVELPDNLVDDEPMYAVTLGDVPTDLLLAAKEHMDNLAREFSLAASGAESGESSPIPAEMAHMVETVLHRFSGPRQAIKRQAIAAVARGDARTQLDLVLPISAADAGDAYLAALDEADAYARTAQILTLATPPQHRAFRRWYVGSLADQLRAVASGFDPPPPPTFEYHLLGEFDTVAAAHSSAQSLAAKLAHLQTLTAQLTAVSHVDEVAEVVVDHASVAFGAMFSALYILEGDTLRAVRSRGNRTTQPSMWESISLDTEMPVCEAVRSGQPVVVRGRGELARRYPPLAEIPLVDCSVACMPLQVGDRQLGVIALTFPVHRDVGDVHELAFFASLADACAQAVDRADALAAARDRADKLTFLADASAELAMSLDYRETLANVARLIVPRLADWCVVQTLDGDEIDNIAVAHVDPEKVEFAEELQRRYPTSPDSPTGLPKVIRTGIAELYPVITDDMLVAGAKDAAHLEITRQLALKSAMVVPLTGNHGAFGAITMVQAESGRHYTNDDLTLATELAHRSAVAVEQARKFDQQTGQLATITRIAETAQHAILAPVPGRVGPVILAGSYLSAAREALVGGDLYEVVSTRGKVRLLIGDVRGKGLDAVRLATVVLGFFRAAAVEERSLARLARQVERRLVPYLGDEDFVTALVVQISPDGSCEIVSCGHPAPLLANADGLAEVACTPSPPLGLGADPEVTHLDLAAGDRLLLYTDGLIEARSPDGRYADLLHVAQPLRAGNLSGGLHRIMARLRQVTGSDLNDDLALLAAEYSPQIPPV